jgi:hypothetical protein
MEVNPREQAVLHNGTAETPQAPNRTRIKLVKYSKMQVGWEITCVKERDGETDSELVKRVFDTDAEVRWEAESRGYTYK